MFKKTKYILFLCFETIAASEIAQKAISDTAHVIASTMTYTQTNVMMASDLLLLMEWNSKEASYIFYKLDEPEKQIHPTFQHQEASRDSLKMNDAMK